MAEVPLPADHEAKLWARWRNDGDFAAHDELALHYLGYARIIAAKLYRTRYNDESDFEEYLQYATVGMLEAMETFDPERQVTFRTYSSRRLHGAVLDGLHSSSEAHRQIWARKTLLAERTASFLVDDGPRPRGADEAFLGLVEVAIGLALGYMLEGSSMFQASEDAVGVEPGYARLEFRQLQDKVVSLVEGLPPREAVVIRAHYFNNVPFQDVARTLGVSKVRVCQLHRQALERLHRSMVELRLSDLIA